MDPFELRDPEIPSERTSVASASPGKTSFFRRWMEAVAAERALAEREGAHRQVPEKPRVA